MGSRIPLDSTRGGTARAAGRHPKGAADRNRAKGGGRKVSRATDTGEDFLVRAFAHIPHLLLRQQIADFKAGLKVGDYVHPQAMSERERDILVDSLKAIDGLRKRVASEFAGEIF